MATYSDLFQLSPKPKKVITMDEAIIHNQDEVINNYVITSNIQDKFDKILHSITLDKGKGYWIQGAYGSGKSHFMSYLTILLNSDKYWGNLPDELSEEYKPKISNKNYLTVNFTLSEINDLKVKVFDEIEKAFKNKGINLTIKKDKKIVDQFLNDEYQGLKEDWFYNILNDCGIDRSTWEQALEENNTENLAEIIISFKQETGAFSHKEYREVIYPSTREGINQLLPLLNEHFDGLILFVDELSEFLQKKKQDQQESKTLETLQMLGETVSETNVWILAAVQKNPAEIIEEEIYIGDEEEKVFDRFDQITLSQADIEEIIDKRIILKNENQKKSIKAIYEDLKKTKSNLEKNITQDRFIKLYPFHHQFVNSLIYLSTFGSRQRAVVKECWEIVNQRLGNRANELITIDNLFDIFSDNIIHDYFKEYHDLYNNLFLETIKKPGFEHDEEMSQRIFKALVIHGLRDKEPLSSEQIVDIIMADLGLGMGLSLINDQVEEILKTVYQEVRGKGIEMIRDENADEEVFYWEINPTSTGINVESEIIENMRGLNENDLMIEIPYFINNNHHLFNKFSIDQQASKMNETFSWRNTDRSGINFYKNINTSTTLKDIDPVNQEVDFGLVMDVPLFESIHKKKEIAKKLAGENNRYIFWLPENLKDETKKNLKRYIAVKKLLLDYSNASGESEVQKKMQLDTEKDKLIKKLDKDIQSAYFNGVMISKNTSIDNPKKYTGIDDIIENCLEDMLNNIYPDHPRYKRNISRTQTNKLIRDFVIPGKSDEYSNEIENVGEPLEIVSRNGDIYNLELNHPIFKKISKKLTDGSWYAADDIYKIARSEPWGMQEYSFEVILAAMISQGECRARDKHDEILTAETFNRNIVSNKLISYVKAISKGKLVNNNIWNDIERLFKIFDKEFMEDRTNRNQDRNWRTLVNHLLSIQTEVESAKKYLFEFAGKLHQFEKVSQKLSIFREFNNFISKILEFKDREADYGLTQFRRILIEEFDSFDHFKDRYYQLKKLLDLSKARVDETLLAYYSYFDQIDLESVNIDDLTEIIEEYNNIHEIIDDKNEINRLLSKSERVKKEYQDIYVKAHNKYHNKYRSFLNDIKDLKEYKTLESLNQIEKVNIHPAIEDKLNNIKKNYSPFCNVELDHENIESRPYCNCEFQLDQKFVPISTDKIKEMFTEGIKSYFKKLKSESYQEQIDIYIDNNPESVLSKISEIEIYDVDDMIKFIDEDIILEINKAFKSSYPVTVSIKEILDIYKGTIPINDIDEVTTRVNKLLREKAEKEINKNQEIDYDRIVFSIKEV